MYCKNCGKKINDNAKFCKYCGASVKDKSAPLASNNNKNNLKQENTNEKQNNENLKLIAIIAIIIAIAAIVIAGVVLSISNDDNDTQVSNTDNSSNIQENSTVEEVSSTSKPAGSWKSIGSFSGSGSGSKTISVPEGQIRIDISAYPIKNYATNHLTVTGSNGESAGVSWGSTSAVATRSDSVSFTSSSPTTFYIDYYETVNWYVNVYRYS